MEAPPERLRRWIPKGTPLLPAAGCPDCAMTGYRGRFSILEILTMTPELERRIAAGEAADRIAEAARRGGMKSLWDSGLAHVTHGESTLDELTRVVDIPSDEAAPGGPEKRTDALRFPPGPGAVRSFSEPAVAAPVSTHFDLLEEPAPPAETRRSGAHGQPASKVLLVDDEDSLRKVMRDLLERDGYIVTEARDGVQALDQVDRVGPDIIVLDLNLPGLDGYGVLSHLRSRPATAAIPVIVLTAKGDEDYVVRPNGPALDVLALRRAPGGRSPGSWETVHGHIEAGETPVEAALRELREETGLKPARLYNLSRVEAFYRHSSNEIALIPVFAGVVDTGAEARPSSEHDRVEWLAPVYTTLFRSSDEIALIP